jgi:hypothetical protein
VCSPSRQSFLVSKRPDHSGVYNFINHFRQADCGLAQGGVAFRGATYKTTKITGCEWGGDAACGGSGQCCSLCTQDPLCTHWTYTWKKLTCDLKTAMGARAADADCVSGPRGRTDTHAAWTSMPQYFKENGWLTLSAGKIFHTEEGGAGNLDPRLNGPGMPPNNDPVAWHDGLSMGKVNDVANMWGCSKGELPGGSLCAVEADMEGNLADPAGNQLCDKVRCSLLFARCCAHRVWAAFLCSLLRAR